MRIIKNILQGVNGKYDRRIKMKKRCQKSNTGYTLKFQNITNYNFKLTIILEGIHVQRLLIS